MSIDCLSIKNFQSHENSKLNLHPGVNVIIGASDTGKSAIFRALSWVIRNKVDDSSFRSRWGGKTDVEITFSDGKEVSRVQDKGNAYYLVDPANNVDEEYKAFRADIPEDISSAVNMDVLNIASQFDPPFLLSDSAGEVAKTLNKIANLTDIDVSISNIRKSVLSNSRDISSTISQLEDLETQKEALSFILELEQKVIEYESLQKSFSELERKSQVLNKTLAVIEETEKKLNLVESFLAIEKDVTLISALVDRRKALESTIRGLKSAITNIETTVSDIEGIDLFLSSEKMVLEALSLVDKKSELKSSYDKLRKGIAAVEYNQQRLLEAEELLNRASDEFERNKPDICPLCEQEIKQ